MQLFVLLFCINSCLAHKFTFFTYLLPLNHLLWEYLLWRHEYASKRNEFHFLAPRITNNSPYYYINSQWIQRNSIFSSSHLTLVNIYNHPTPTSLLSILKSTRTHTVKKNPRYFFLRNNENKNSNLLRLQRKKVLTFVDLRFN